MDSHKTELALAIEQRERKLHPFEVQGFFGLARTPVRTIGIRVATKADEDQALLAAHAVVNAATELKEARADFDLIGDTKLIQILYRVCFSVTEKTSNGVPYPAFPSPSWMRENMTTDQIAVLMNLYHEVRQKEGPIKWDITTERVMALAFGVAATADTDMPEAMLADLDRTWLTHAFVILAGLYREAFDELHGDAGHDADEGDAREDPSAPGFGPDDHDLGAEPGGGAGAPDAHLHQPDVSAADDHDGDPGEAE